jgi:small-conductance mechanosensitive channel
MRAPSYEFILSDHLPGPNNHELNNALRSKPLCLSEVLIELFCLSRALSATLQLFLVLILLVLVIVDNFSDLAFTFLDQVGRSWRVVLFENQLASLESHGFERVKHFLKDSLAHF